MLSFESSSPPTGVAGSDGGSGTWVAERVGFGVGLGRGRPNAPPNVGAAALDANAARAGVGRDEVCTGLLGCKDDLRYDSVKSDESDVSSCNVSIWKQPPVWTHFARDLHATPIFCFLLNPPDAARVDHPELDRTA